MAITSYIKNGKQLYAVKIKSRDQHGRQIYRSKFGITSERKANEAEFELKKEVERILSQKPQTIWKGWLEHCLATMKLQFRASTYIGYKGLLSKWVTPYWGQKELKDFTKSDVHTLIFETIEEDKMSLHSRQTVLKMIKRIFQMAVEEGILNRNPCVGICVRVPEVEQKVFTSNEAEIFLREAKICNHDFYPIWVLALMTGMRSGELFALEWTDIDFDGKIIRVNKQWTKKNGLGSPKARKNRIVPISDELSDFLKERKLLAGQDSKYVLPHLKEWEHSEQSMVTREFCAAVGITPIKFHDLRATFITNLLSRGVSLARVMSIVGHSQLKTTNGYLRKAGVDVQGATDNLGYQLFKEQNAKVIPLAR